MASSILLVYSTFVYVVFDVLFVVAAVMSVPTLVATITTTTTTATTTLILHIMHILPNIHPIIIHNIVIVLIFIDVVIVIGDVDRCKIVRRIHGFPI